jgi:hypothetical protein
MVHRLKTAHIFIVVTAFGTALPGLAAGAAADTAHHSHHKRHPAAVKASAPVDHPAPAAHEASTATACNAPLGPQQHDPAVRSVKLQRDEDGSAVVTMCLVSNQPMLINPSASIGVFNKNGVLAGTAARAVAGRFQPTVGPDGGLRAGQSLTIVPITLEVPADPPLPPSLQGMAMVQLAWDSCSDDTCSKPTEQSLAMLLPMRVTGGGKAAPDSQVTVRDVVASRAPMEPPPSHDKLTKHHPHHEVAAVAEGAMY